MQRVLDHYKLYRKVDFFLRTDPTQMATVYRTKCGKTYAINFADGDIQELIFGGDGIQRLVERGYSPVIPEK